MAVPIVITSATGTKAVTLYEVWSPLQKETNHQINRTLQLRSTPTIFTCFEVLEILTVLVGVGTVTRNSYQLINEFLVSRAQMRTQENLSERNTLTEVRETKAAEK